MVMAAIISHIKSDGYGIIRNFLPEGELAALEEEFRLMIQRHYTPENLLAHSVYPADKAASRESHAMMIAIAETERSLPAVDHHGCAAIGRFLQWHNRALAELTGYEVAPSARALLNWQEYRQGSKPVGEHFDGEYLRADRRDDVEFTLLEGILPRYVALLTLKNANQGRGIELIKDGRVIAPLLEAGDLIVFDNIGVRHRVPQLSEPRTTMGLRSFDHRALHFVRQRYEGVPGAHYRPIAEGFISEEVDCRQRFQEFIAHEWPAMRDSYGAYV